MIGYIIGVVGLLALMLRMNILHKKELSSIMERHSEELEAERANAIKKSKSVIRGQVSEQLIPLFPDFPYRIDECKFSGQPIDYIVFNGMNDIRDGKEAIIDIILADVKVGQAQRTKVQNAIKNAIDNKRVRWETWRIGEDNKIKIK